MLVRTLVYFGTFLNDEQVDTLSIQYNFIILQFTITYYHHQLLNIMYINGDTLYQSIDVAF